jgi:hypothetical protein
LAANSHHDKDRDTKQDPLGSPEFREFTASIRELFREIKKLVIFLRNKRNIGAATLVATLLLALFAFVQSLVTGLQIKPLRTTADTARKELELSQRPWVSLENFSIESPLTFDNNGAHVTIGYEVRNTGRSPAIRGFWQPEFFLQFGEVPSPVEKRDDACKFAAYRSTKVTDSRITETWFPGDGIPKRLGLSIEPNDIAKALEIPKQMFPNSGQTKDFEAIYPDLVICVAYRAAFTDAQYHTGYILELRSTNLKMPYILPMKSGEIPATELKLFIHPFYGIYAD